VIVGVSTRAAADSAARAGYAVTAIDAFGDLDQHPSVHSLSLPRDFKLRFSARSAARVSSRIGSDVAVYLASFENHPAAVKTLAARCTLWGNPPEVLRRVRDPTLVARALRDRGHAVPAGYLVREKGLHGDGREWLLKPLASGGGRRVRRWRPGTRWPRRSYVQELVVGTPGSVVFAAAGGRAVPLGVSRQLIGEVAFGVSGYRYCGSILAGAADMRSPDAAVLVDRACAVAGAVAGEFGLVGVNGVDFVACAGVPYPIEVNPRWCASMELVERASGVSVFAAHAAACATGALPEFDLLAAMNRGAPAAGKAIVFARHDVEIGDTREWLSRYGTAIGDVPHPGERIGEGQPICTVFASASDSGACHALLVERAERVYSELGR
jgi:predicted ATP-grasp superfamily ATP-dependent carboligase